MGDFTFFRNEKKDGMANSKIYASIQSCRHRRVVKSTACSRRMHIRGDVDVVICKEDCVLLIPLTDVTVITFFPK